jgi:cell wall-associated NlpC family hydrolase
MVWTSGGSVLMPGGFDCSGFVWRVFKLEPLPEVPGLESVLRGRTTYQMSGEVPVAERVDVAGLEPADVVFFGSAGVWSQPSQVGHMGIALGNGWFVHSSNAGVTLQPLDGWYQRTFAWARRPLAEAARTVDY